MNNKMIRIKHENISTFDGDADNFQLWWKNFKTFAVFALFDKKVMTYFKEFYEKPILFLNLGE